MSHDFGPNTSCTMLGCPTCHPPKSAQERLRDWGGRTVTFEAREVSQFGGDVTEWVVNVSLKDKVNVEVWANAFDLETACKHAISHLAVAGVIVP